jgi:hypothetical protein
MAEEPQGRGARRVQPEMTAAEIRAMAGPRTLSIEFTGGWCDNCGVAARTRSCLDRRHPMRPAKIRVEPTDVHDEEWPR